MGGLLLLLALSAVMALASFLAGALPLSMTLTQSQLRLISSIGVGILVGTSLIVIIPEGVEAVAATILSPAGADTAAHTHQARYFRRIGLSEAVVRSPITARTDVLSDTLVARAVERALPQHIHIAESRSEPSRPGRTRQDDVPAKEPEVTDDKTDIDGHRPQKGAKEVANEKHEKQNHEEEASLPTFYIGFALVAGFVLMFLIDRLPRHAVDKLQTAPTTRHISLDNLASSSASGDGDVDNEGEGFLGSLTPSPRQSRGLATTVGLVIHAAADGIAMGASATTEDMKLGLVIFVAIMVHKAPAAFGLTSVLLKHGLSKRAARGHLVVFSLAAPFGALTTYIIISLVGGRSMEGEHGQWWTGMLLLFSAGTFLYVAMQAMQEESGGGGGHDHHPILGGNGYADSSSMAAQRKQARPQMRDTLATIGGMLLPLLTQFGHHH